MMVIVIVIVKKVMMSRAGLEDELSTYRKNGYLEKMSFLKKTDDHLEAELKEQRQKER
jgi:hypothetical protein